VDLLFRIIINLSHLGNLMEDQIYCEKYARELALTFMFSFYLFLGIRWTFPGLLFQVTDITVLMY